MVMRHVTNGKAFGVADEQIAQRARTARTAPVAVDRAAQVHPSNMMGAIGNRTARNSSRAKTFLRSAFATKERSVFANRLNGFVLRPPLHILVHSPITKMRRLVCSLTKADRAPS